MSIQIVAEIGINHNGDVDLAKRLVLMAKECGCDLVKFQKRTVDMVYTKEDLDKPRESPYGMTNRALKRGLELTEDDFNTLDHYCYELGIGWTASAWDPPSLEMIASYNPPYFKIASACLTDDPLLKLHRMYGKPIVLSTGMSTLEQIDHAVSVLGTSALTLLHCNSSYPAKYEELNLNVIKTLQERYRIPVGYSGHETGLASTVATVAMGVVMIERHITLDRAMWGSDQAASLEENGLRRLVRDIRLVETSLGDGVKRVYDSERLVMKKLRRFQ